ncbi:MAG: hypothetical protein MJ252_11680 [archaeon]|nr:hypothetical protein [archaeon]
MPKIFLLFLFSYFIVSFSAESFSKDTLKLLKNSEEKFNKKLKVWFEDGSNSISRTELNGIIENALLDKRIQFTPLTDAFKIIIENYTREKLSKYVSNGKIPKEKVFELINIPSIYEALNEGFKEFEKTIIEKRKIY